MRQGVFAYFLVFVVLSRVNPCHGVTAGTRLLLIHLGDDKGRWGFYCGRSYTYKRQKQGYYEDASVGFHDDGRPFHLSSFRLGLRGAPICHSLSLGQGLGGIGSYRIRFGLPPFSLSSDTFHCSWRVLLHGRW